MEQTKAPSPLETIVLKQGAAVFRAVNHPLRQVFLQLLHESGRLDVTTIYQKLKLDQSTASLHLGLLRKAGVVTAEREGRQIYYTVNYRRLAQVIDAAQQLANSLQK